MHKNFKFRLYPTPTQEAKMKSTLENCRWLYNHFLEQRKTAWEERKESLTMFEQNSSLTDLKLYKPSLNKIYSQIPQDVSTRVDLAFKAFFRRCKNKENPGYPRFKQYGRYDSFTYPQIRNGGVKIKGSRLHLSKIGAVKIVFHRDIFGVIKTCTIKHTSTEKWFAIFSCEVKTRHPVVNPLDNPVGIDVGLSSFATLSNGEKIDNPRFFKKEEKELARVQRKFSKTKKESQERKKKKRVVARVYERITNKRHNFSHQLSRKIVDTHTLIAIEDLNINKMLHDKCFSKSISDAAWNLFTSTLSYKAEEAGKKLVKVNPAYTSQDCSSCGHRQLIPLVNRVYNCPCCNLVMDRDTNAARNILTVGLHSLELSPESSQLNCWRE